MVNRGDQPNVVLIVGDTVRARDISAYGHVNTSPNIDELAASGVVFERAYTNAPWTLPAHASLFTGTLPSEHGCHGGSPGLDADRTVASHLSNDGYETHGISNNIWLSRHFGFDNGFDEFIQNWKLFQNSKELAHLVKPSVDAGWVDVVRKLFSGNVLKNAANSLYGKYFYRRNDYGGQRTTETARKVIESTDSPFFLFCNYMEPHSKYTPNEFTQEFVPGNPSLESLQEYAKLSRQSPEYHLGDLEISEEEFAILRGLYDGEIRYFDREVGKIVDALRANELFADTMIIVIGDHGENIGDHGLMEHKFSVHDTLLHVPAVIKYPESYGTTGRETTPIDFRDLFAEVTAVTTRDEPLLVDHRRTDPVVAEYLSTDYVEEANDESLEFAGSEYDRLLSAVVTAEHKLVTDGDNRSLYRYEETGTNMNKTEVDDPSVAEQLARHATEFAALNEDTHSSDINAGVERHLEDLGYM